MLDAGLPQILAFHCQKGQNQCAFWVAPKIYYIFIIEPKKKKKKTENSKIISIKHAQLNIEKGVENRNGFDRNLRY